MAESNTLTDTVVLFINLTANNTSDQVATVINWLTFSIGLPAIALAIYALKNLSKGDTKLPISVIFLLVSDVISFFGRPHVGQGGGDGGSSLLSANATDFIFNFGVISNIALMLFIAQERHVSVAYPQCTGGCNSVRGSPVVTLLAWAAPLAVLALAVLKFDFWFSVALLVPFPFLFFFAVDSWRAVICSRSHRATPERRRAAWGVAAIWANYTFLYAPFILSVLLGALSFGGAVVYLELVSHLLLYLSPLVDPFIYIFMSRGLKEVLRALPCCPNPKQKENKEPAVDTVAETVETIETRL